MKSAAVCLAAVLLINGADVAAQSTPAGNLGGAATFGQALGVAGPDVLVGEPNIEDQPGRVYVYRKKGAAWSDAAALSAVDGAPADGFGNTLAASGDLLLVGALRANQNRGAAYIFRRTGGTWQQVARLAARDGSPAENFGAALAISSQIAVIGAPGQNLQQGAVYVYRRNGDAWTQEARLVSPNAADRQFFGQAVAIAGDRIIVGEPGHGSRAGAVHVFARQDGPWKAVDKLLAANAQNNDQLGAPIVADAEGIYVGALGYGNSSGAVYRFQRDGTGRFKETARYTAEAGKPGDRFGAALAAARRHLWVGAPRANGGGGAAYRFTRDAVVPVQLAEAGPSDYFGNAIAAEGDVAVIAAANDDFGLGSITIFELANGKWSASQPIGRPDLRMASHAGGKIECVAGKAGEFPCANIDLQAMMSVADLGGARGVQLSGIWGWTDPQTEREYALVGRVDGTAFVDVTDPTHPRYLGDLPLTPGAHPSWWREIKTYRNYMLVSADGAGAHGVQIFDLTQLRGVQQPASFKPTVTYQRVNSVHNIVVNEESGFAYAVGSNSGGETCGGGLHMIDMRNPLDPQFAGCFADPQTGRANTGYTHDALCIIYRGPDRDYQNREICLGANETMLSIADVTDKRQAKVVSRTAYPKVGYLHQGWLTKDSRYFFMNDELDEVSGLVPNTRTLIWDLIDLDDPQMVKEFMHPTQASDHNLYIKDDLMYQSHYKAGVRLVDVSNPLEPKEVGYFDTAPTAPDKPGFDGSWGNYPYFKSGTWIASSVNEGLFVLKKKDNKPVL